MATCDELPAAAAVHYAAGTRADRGRILGEFTAVTGFHRTHAMRVLRARGARPISGPRPGRRVYDDAVREALIVLWDTSDQICGKRLRPMVAVLVESMERHGHLRLAAKVIARLLTMSAATIDRALKQAKRITGGDSRRRSSPTALRRSIPGRTLGGWSDPAPGYVEADLVTHSGPTAKGSFVQTLTLTDIAMGWTECAPLLVREQTLLTDEAATLLAAKLKTPLQIGQHLVPAFEAGFENGTKPIDAGVVEASSQLNELEPQLTRNGYDLRSLVEQFDAKPAEIRRLLRGDLDAGRSQELMDEMRAAGLPT